MSTFSVPCLSRSALRACVGALVLAGAGLSSPDRAWAQIGCVAPAARVARLAGLDERLEMSLDDGTHLRLFGVEPPRATAAHPVLAIEARDKLRDWLMGLDLSVEAVAPAPDRWGRQAARVVAPPPGGGPASLSVAESLLDAGLARVRVEPGPLGCMAPLLAAERRGRDAGLGLWTDPAYAPLAASNRAAFASRAGQMLLVEGVVASVGETKSRLYLNFGPIRTLDFSLTIPRAALRAFAAAGVDPHGLAGQTIRARGVLDLRFGPQIEIVQPAAIEIVATIAAAPYYRPVARQ